MLKKILIKLLLILYRKQNHFITHTKDRFNIALGRDKVIYSEQSGFLPDIKNIERVAVIVIYPNKNIVPFIINLMDGFANNGFFVLAISHKNIPSEMSDAFRAHCHKLIECFPIGKDFGCYKLGIDWIERQPYLQSMNTLALANDSLYYPKDIEKTTRDLLELDGNWLGLHENFATGRHVQSFFQIFRNDALKSEAFKRFWKNYKPLSSRVYCIENGEKGLTRALLKGGFQPSVLYNSSVIRENVYKSLTCKNIDANFYGVFTKTLRIHNPKFAEEFVVKKKQPPTSSLPSYELLKISEASFYAGFLCENFNPTHNLGILINSLFQAPIKRDICLKWSNFTFSEVVFFADGFTDSEKNSMERELRSNGNPASIVLFSKRWFRLHSGVE